MKLLLLSLALSFSVSSFSQVDQVDCNDPQNQQEMNICSARDLKKAAGKLVDKVITKCKMDTETRASEGGTLYPLLVTGCATRKIKALTRKI